MLWYGIIIASNGKYLQSMLPELIVTAMMVMNVDKSNKLSRISLDCMSSCHMVHVVTCDLVHHFVDIVENCRQGTKKLVHIPNRSCERNAVWQDGVPTGMSFTYLLTDCEEALKFLHGRRLLNVKWRVVIVTISRRFREVDTCVTDMSFGVEKHTEGRKVQLKEV